MDYNFGSFFHASLPPFLYSPDVYPYCRHNEVRQHSAFCWLVVREEILARTSSCNAATSIRSTFTNVCSRTEAGGLCPIPSVHESAYLIAYLILRVHLVRCRTASTCQLGLLVVPVVGDDIERPLTHCFISHNILFNQEMANQANAREDSTSEVSPHEANGFVA